MARWCGEAGAGLFIAGVRRFGEIFLVGLAGEGGALAGLWWPAGIPDAGRRDGSCRATRWLGRGVGRPRWQLSSMRSGGGLRQCGRRDGRGGAELDWRWS
jgi:hypothetical protein